MDRSLIYLDNNATTMVAPEVVEAMMPFLREKWGNPSSIHRFGGSVHRSIDQAREQAAGLIGASPDEVFFTSCGSESDNMALKGFFALHGATTRIITSTVEHPAVHNTAHYLKDRGATLIELEVDAQGCIDPALFDADILIPNQNETALLCCEPASDIHSAKLAGSALLARGAKVVIVTLGRRGALALSADKMFHIPPFNTSIVDTTGVGDAFCGAFAAAYARQKDIYQAFRFAAAAGALACAKFGAQPSIPHLDAIKHAIAFKNSQCADRIFLVIDYDPVGTAPNPLKLPSEWHPAEDCPRPLPEHFLPGNLPILTQR